MMLAGISIVHAVNRLSVLFIIIVFIVVFIIIIIMLTDILVFHKEVLL